MRKTCAYGAAATFAALVFAAPPAAAFGLRIGPFHIGLPFGGHRHHHPHYAREHHPLYMHANPREVVHPEQGQPELAHEATPALLYPNLALSTIFQNVFWPAVGSPWPFGYQDIFATAFAKTPAERAPSLCRQSDDPDAIVGRLRAEIAPTADQMQALQKLGGALHAATDYLAKSCPNAIPARPVARLQLMESQIEELAMAIDMIRQPLQDFAQSLNDEQKARFAAMIEAPANAHRRNQTDNIASSCDELQTSVDRSIDQIDQSVQPTDVQRTALDDVKKSFSQAASDLEAHCRTSIPPTALGRLQTIEARLDATWRAVLSIQVALANFETRLSDEQKSRFDSMQFAAR